MPPRPLGCGGCLSAASGRLGCLFGKAGSFFAAGQVGGQDMCIRAKFICKGSQASGACAMQNDNCALLVKRARDGRPYAAAGTCDQRVISCQIKHLLTPFSIPQTEDCTHSFRS